MSYTDFDPEKELRKMTSECIDGFLNNGEGFWYRAVIDEHDALREYCGFPFVEPIKCCCMHGRVMDNPEKPGQKTFECKLLDLAGYVRYLLKQGSSVEKVNDSILKFKDDFVKRSKGRIRPLIISL